MRCLQNNCVLIFSTCEIFSLDAAKLIAERRWHVRASTPKPVSGGNILFGSEMIPSGYDLNFYMNTPSGMTSFPMGPPNLLLVINLIYISTPWEVYYLPERLQLQIIIQCSSVALGLVMILDDPV